MHADEIDTDVPLVARLLTAQFPQWSQLPITPVASAGTDNALYQLGADMVVRLPRIHWATEQINKEHAWLPRLAPHLPLAIPIPLAKGEPGEGYPWHWAIHRWLKGENATVAQIIDLHQIAIDLAQFIIALQRIDTMGAPPLSPDSRGGRLSVRNTRVREAIAALHGMIDTDPATAAWDNALQSPQWNRAPVWFHGDLLPGNLLIEQGRLNGVIDWGALGVGDPACDLLPAWTLLSGESRDAFRAALQVDDAMWMRGRGWALSIGLIALPYYQNTNPVLAGIAQRAIAQVLAEAEER